MAGSGSRSKPLSEIALGHTAEVALSFSCTTLSAYRTNVTLCNEIERCFLPLPLTWLQPFNFPHKLGICERLFGSAIAPQGICWVQGAGISWKLDLANPTHRWIIYGKYEGAPFLEWSQKVISPDGIVIDSGANI